MPLDTNIPSWLQRNWAPRESFDPTPWLQEQYRRKVVEAELPHRIQRLALQNQADQIAIEQSAMETEFKSMELGQYQSELPVVNEWLKGTGGDPLKVLNNPVPSVVNPKLQQAILSAKKMAAESTYAQTVEKYQLGLTEAATKLVSKGKYIQPLVDQQGRASFDPADLAAAAEDLEASDRDFILQRIAAQTEWHTQAGGVNGTPVTPQIVTLSDGTKLINNPKTGHFERLDKTLSRTQFIAQNVTKWMSDFMIDTEGEAADRLGKFYDEHIAKKAESAPPASPSEKVRVRHPDGRTGTIPSADLQRALTQGFQEVK
jgi:hypothetical protein